MTETATRHSRPVTGLAIAAATGLCLLAGYLIGDRVSSLVHNRQLPWIIARASGIGLFVALTAICVLGLLFRGPVGSSSLLRRETVLRIHAALGPAIVALLATHVISLGLDKWAHVGWTAVAVPGASHYRTNAVTIGCIATYLLAVALLSAVFAGRRPVGSRWVWPHRAAYPAFVTALVHGLLAGSDTTILLWMYIAGGGAVAASFVSRLGRAPKQTAREIDPASLATERSGALPAGGVAR